MPITQDGNGQILYTEPPFKERSDDTGTVVDNQFAIVDQDNVLKQIQFNILPTTTTKGTLTITAAIAGDSTIDLTSLSPVSNAFGIVQPITGTSPTADTPADTLTLTSSDNSLGIAGNATTDTLDFTVLEANIDHNSLSNLTVDDAHTQYTFLTGRSGGQIQTGGTASGNNFTLRSTSNASKGAIVLDETTASTSPTTGSLKASGGIGIAGSLGLGGAVYLGSGNVVSISSNHTVASTEYVQLCNTSGGTFTLTLPSPSTRQVVYIKDSNGTFQTNNLTVARSASETIEGIAASKILSTNFGSWTFVSNGTNWFVL